MTLPDERYRAVKWAGEFLQSLMDPKATPRIPKHVRAQARMIMRHYPGEYYLSLLAEARPDVMQEKMDDLHKFVLKGYREDKDN